MNETEALDTRINPDTGLFEVQVDGAWHHRASWPQCCSGERNLRAGEHPNTPLTYRGYKEGETTTFWSVCPVCGRQSRSTEAGFRLETRMREGAIEVRVDGRWRHRKDLERFCSDCLRESGEQVPLEYYGAANRDGSTRFWAVCPACGQETRPTWVGRRQRKERHRQEPGWLRLRRAASGY